VINPRHKKSPELDFATGDKLTQKFLGLMYIRDRSVSIPENLEWGYIKNQFN